MSRVVNDTRDFELLYAHMIPETITNIVTFAGVLIILLSINTKLALITCEPIPFIMISGVIFAKKVRPYFRISQKKMGELNGRLQDNLSGIYEIQSFGRQEYETGRINEKNFDHVRAMLKALKISADQTDQNRSLYRRMDNNIRNAIYEEKKAGTHSSPPKSEIMDGVSCVH